MNKSKRSLRSTLADLAAAFADAVLAAARESVLELATEQAPQTRRPRTEPARSARSRVGSAERPRPARAARAPARAARTKPSRTLSEPPASPAGDLLITDPQALLAALETADPSTAWDGPSEAQSPRTEPEILRPVVPKAAPASAHFSGPDQGARADHFSTFAPVLREGEVIVRRSAGGVVLRRRRA